MSYHAYSLSVFFTTELTINGTLNGNWINLNRQVNIAAVIKSVSNLSCLFFFQRTKIASTKFPQLFFHFPLLVLYSCEEFFCLSMSSVVIKGRLSLHAIYNNNYLWLPSHTASCIVAIFKCFCFYLSSIVVASHPVSM